MDQKTKITLIVTMILTTTVPLILAGSSVSAATNGGPNCISCHNIGSDNATIDFDATNASIHKNLDSSASDTTGEPRNKKCWACHGNGTQPVEHPQNYKNPFNCTDCHGVGKGNYSAPIIYEHNKVSGDIRTTANCEDCHNNSVLASLDSGIPNAGANVSHYGTNTSLNPGGSNTTNCVTCHKSEGIAKQWYVQPNVRGSYTVRHPANGDGASVCANCHNSSSINNFHDKRLYKYPYPDMHYSFDWEGDDHNESGEIGEWESCFACHKDGFYQTKICEDCHVINSSIGTPDGPYTDGINLRSDILDLIPKVYNHINASDYYNGVELGVPNMSGRVGGNRPSSCYDYNTADGRGVCHGVNYHNSSLAANYSAHSRDEPASGGAAAPYMWNNPIDDLPATSNCLFCHNMSNTTWRSSWGDALQVTPENMFGATTVGQCYTCHTTTGQAPKFFHDQEMRPLGGGPDCVSCHDIGTSQGADIDVSVMNSSKAIHKLLNNRSTDSGSISDPNQEYDWNNRRCWACHSNGSKPANGSMGINFQSPWLCYDCHTNVTGGMNTTTQNGNYSAPGVFAHLPASASNSYSPAYQTRLTTTVTCWTCHNNSVLVTNDTEFGTMLTNYDRSNVSHYGTKDYLKVGSSSTSTKDCIGCHKESPGESAKWYAIYLPDVGYSRMGTNAANTCWLCHVGNPKEMTATIPTSFHETRLVAPTWKCTNCHPT